MIHPRTRMVVLHRAAAEARLLRAGDRIEGGDVFGGRSVPVTAIFGD